VRILGLKDHGVDYVRNESNARWITPERRARLDRLTQEIIDGTIRVPAE
jgi:basic membrane lipoprotein Med (substrate-binding protein (PBP1-ABC) superfamily)